MPKSNPSREFEQQVAELYRRLGFTVTHNERLVNQQVDIIAEKRVSGIGEVFLIVECKSHGRPVGVNDVAKFFASVVIARHHNRAFGGVMVSASGFTADAKGIARDLPYVWLLEPDELDERAAGHHGEPASFRRVLGSLSSSCEIVSPAESEGPRDQLALIHLGLAYGLIGLEPTTLSSADAEDERLRNRLVLGGWLHNDLTLQYLKGWCSGFSTDDGDRDTWVGTTSYRCGGKRFADSEVRVHGYLVRLAPRRRRCFTFAGPPLHLVWGHRGTGTAAAAYYLTHHHDRLNAAFRSRPYFVVVTAPAGAYSDVDPKFVDITEPALFAPRRPSSP
jgi:hypothetical protein